MSTLIPEDRSKAGTTTTIMAMITTTSLAFSMPLPRQIDMTWPAVISAESIADFGSNRNISLAWDSSCMTPQISDSISRLNEIKDLQDNWNGNGASAFSDEIIQKAKEIVYGLSIQPTILPTARDSIQMEYELENGDYLEFELFESGRLKMFQYTHDGKSETKDIPSASAKEVILDFYGRKI